MAWHDKQAADKRFTDLFRVLMKGADDNRNYVKKAVSWAVRNIGKRNRKLNKAAIKLAKDIQRLESKAARWVAADALREIQSEAIQRRFND
ncbi:MAG: DNA alkylation repair protein [Anaerolineales bacterium]